MPRSRHSEACDVTFPFGAQFCQFVGAICALCVALVAATFALFNGYFDHGLFEIKQTEWSSSGNVTILAKRSDHQALSSDVYFFGHRKSYVLCH